MNYPTNLLTNNFSRYFNLCIELILMLFFIYRNKMLIEKFF